MAHVISDSLQDTIVISSVKIQLLKTFKMIINHQGKFAVLGYLIRADWSTSIRKSIRCNSMGHVTSTFSQDIIAILLHSDWLFFVAFPRYSVYTR